MEISNEKNPLTIFCTLPTRISPDVFTTPVESIKPSKELSEGVVVGFSEGVLVGSGVGDGELVL